MKERYKNICLEFDKISEGVNLSSMSQEDGAKFVILANEISQGDVRNKIDKLLNLSEDVNKFDYIKKQKNQLMYIIIKWEILLDKYPNVSEK